MEDAGKSFYVPSHTESSPLGYAAFGSSQMVLEAQMALDMIPVDSSLSNFANDFPVQQMEERDDEDDDDWQPDCGPTNPFRILNQALVQVVSGEWMIADLRNEKGVKCGAVLWHTTSVGRSLSDVAQRIFRHICRHAGMYNDDVERPPFLEKGGRIIPRSASWWRWNSFPLTGALQQNERLYSEYDFFFVPLQKDRRLLHDIKFDTGVEESSPHIAAESPLGSSSVSVGLPGEYPAARVLTQVVDDKTAAYLFFFFTYDCPEFLEDARINNYPISGTTLLDSVHLLSGDRKFVEALWSRHPKIWDAVESASDPKALRLLEDTLCAKLTDHELVRTVELLFPLLLIPSRPDWFWVSVYGMLPSLKSIFRHCLDVLVQHQLLHPMLDKVEAELATSTLYSKPKPPTWLFSLCPDVACIDKLLGISSHLALSKLTPGIVLTTGDRPYVFRYLQDQMKHHVDLESLATVTTNVVRALRHDLLDQESVKALTERMDWDLWGPPKFRPTPRRAAKAPPIVTGSLGQVALAGYVGLWYSAINGGPLPSGGAPQSAECETASLDQRFQETLALLPPLTLEILDNASFWKRFQYMVSHSDPLKDDELSQFAKKASQKVREVVPAQMLLSSNGESYWTNA
eukprot:scaffold4709_cov212-Amphora_coffeaeformis.AAC.1